MNDKINDINTLLVPRAPLAAPAQAVPASVIMASVMRDDGGEHPAFCLMVAYRAEKDAMTALAMLTDEPAQQAAPAPARHPVAAPEPHYGNGRYLGFARHNDAYSVAQVQAMLAAVPRNATLYDPDDVAFPVQRCADGTDALPPELASIAKQASTAAAEVAAPIAPAREPLTDEQIDEIHLANSDAYERGDVEYESHGFARAIEHHHGITAAKKGGQHGTE